MASSYRVNRVRELLMRESTDIIRQLKDPRIRFVTVIDIELSKEVINHSYEDMKFSEKSSRTGNAFKYYLKYKIFYKIYTLVFLLFTMIKRILLLRF